VSGFEATANHVAVITLPVILDMVLWFGLRLNISSILKPAFEQAVLNAKQLSLPAADMVSVQAQFKNVAEQFNLLSLLNTLPVGVPSLMSWQLFSKSPLEIARVFDISNVPVMLLLSMGLVITGWILGSSYYYWVSSITSPDKKGSAKSFFYALLQTFFLAFFMVAIIVGVGIPIMMVLTLLALISPALVQVIVLISFFAFLWTLPILFFSLHGIYAYGKDVISSILGSVRMVRYTLPTTGLFVFTMCVLWYGLNSLWKVPPSSSWMTLIGIIGHAFVASALLASSFVYYRNVNSWLQIVLERFNTSASSASV
jgi:hypothetical protein